MFADAANFASEIGPDRLIGVSFPTTAATGLGLRRLWRRHRLVLASRGLQISAVVAVVSISCAFSSIRKCTRVPLGIASRWTGPNTPWS
jgi:hypothetical protein